MTEIEIANIRLKCAEIAIQYGTRLDFKKDACLEVSEMIFGFVMKPISSKNKRKAGQSR